MELKHHVPSLGSHPPLQEPPKLVWHLKDNGEQGVPWDCTHGYSAWPKSSHLKRHEKLGVGNLRLLYCHALDLIRCIHLSLGISKSIATKTYGYKNHIRIKI